MTNTTKIREKRCYSVSEVQEMLGISKPAVYELIKRNEFRTVKIGGRYKISKRSFDAWLDGSFGGEMSPEEIPASE